MSRWDEEDPRFLPRESPQRGENQLGHARVPAGGQILLLQHPQSCKGTFAHDIYSFLFCLFADHHHLFLFALVVNSSGEYSIQYLEILFQDEWVVCRVFHKNAGSKRSLISGVMRVDSFGDDLLDCPSLPPLVDLPNKNDSCYSNGDQDGMIKGSSTRFSDGNHRHHYFSTSMNGPQLQKQQDQKGFLLSPNNVHTTSNYQASLSNPTPNPIFYPQVSAPNPLFPFQPSPTHAYPHWNICSSLSSFPATAVRDHGAQNSGIQRQCKVEQFSSNHSMVSLSQDTGLSTDINTEISSVLSKHHDMGNNGSYEDLEVPSSVGQIGDLDYLLNY